LYYWANEVMVMMMIMYFGGAVLRSLAYCQGRPQDFG